MFRSCSALLLATLVLAACGGGTAQRERPAKPAPVPSNTAGWKVSLQAAEPLVPNQPTAFTARLADAAGSAISGADVMLSLNMTTMDMGENRARLTEKEPGTYTGNATFTMKGPWQVALEASRGGDRVVQLFDYNIR